MHFKATTVCFRFNLKWRQGLLFTSKSVILVTGVFKNKIESTLFLVLLLKKKHQLEWNPVVFNLGSRTSTHTVTPPAWCLEHLVWAMHFVSYQTFFKQIEFHLNFSIGSNNMFVCLNVTLMNFLQIHFSRNPMQRWTIAWGTHYFGF